ncbi:alpha-amylase family protein [Arthrobacter sp. VKM Ac-2550]|uniref:alpha-amylase family protein n=1 Tax=Crystallibacter permensis TaxID=1938888 RepID=UPI0022276847|nr:alpha-amylase family protein [Arthrobacter sp. VKM Ac-2550]MCW2135294.1 Glycosidase [Arthrobacter sp. VKM Ac-2550]
MARPGWVENVIWWQVYPLGFVGAERDAPAEGSEVQHRLPRLTAWLDYVVELGASGIALGPVFAAETHGYDTTDYFRIDPRLGDEADFEDFIAAAHSRGLRVLLDGVFNHVGRSFDRFQQVLREGPEAPSSSWFKLSWPEGQWSPGTEPDYEDFEGHHHLVALNHVEPQVRDFVVEVMKYWLARGADGWRLDAAYAVPPSFWAPVLDAVRADYPDAYFVGEFIHGDYAAAVAEGKLGSVTQYELWKAVWSSLNDVNLYELSAALDRHNGFLESFAPLTFVGNHDVTRLASKLSNTALLPHAVVILLTLGGTPSIYAGDEQGFRGVKEDRAGGDDAVRPAFPDSPAELSNLGVDIYRLHQELIGVRRRLPWLHRARTRVLALANEHLVYESLADGHCITVALNLAGSPVSVDAPADSRTVLARGGDVGVGGDGLELGPFAWAILGSGDD